MTLEETLKREGMCVLSVCERDMLFIYVDVGLGKEETEKKR